MVTNQKCFGCKKKSTISLSYGQKEYCDICFLKMIEKRVRKDIRTSRSMNTSKGIELFNDNSKEYKVAKNLLKNIFGEHMDVKEVKIISKNTFIPTNLDREIRNKISFYLKNKKETLEGKKLLQNVLEEEIIAFCKIKKIKIEKKEEKNFLIEGVDKIYPGTKFALAKSFDKIFP